MNKNLKQTIMLLLTLFISSALLSAEDLTNNAGSITFVTVEDSKPTMDGKDYDGDYFFGGESLEYSGSADDFYLFGNTIGFSGKSSGSLTAFANTVDLSGTVGKNFHSMGSTVKIFGHIRETAFIGAGTITIGPDAVIDGTLIVGCNTIRITGTLNNGLLAGAGEVIIDGPVSGNVIVKAGKLIITERGSIHGNLTYDSKVEISEKEKARVSGIVEYDISEKITGNYCSRFFIIAKVLFFAALLVTGLLLLLLPAVKALYGKSKDRKKFGKTLLWGLIPLFIYPVAIIVTIPLFPLSIALALAAFPLMGLTTILGLVFSGQFLFTLLKWENDNLFLQFLAAFAIFSILVLIPYAGVPVMLAVAAAGSGLLIGKIFKTDF